MKKKIMRAVCVMAMCVIGLCSVNAQKNGTGAETSVPEGITDGSKPSIAKETVKFGDNGDVSFVVVYDKKKEELWTYCRRWMAETFQNYNSIKQLEDRQGGLLICNYVAGLYAEGQDGKFYTRWSGTNKWKMTITCKDQRLRVQMTEYVATWSSQGKGSMGWMPALPQESFSYAQARKMMGTDRFDNQEATVLNKVSGDILSALYKYGTENDF